jgi:glycosyltransferase involved in cell wall biosynthesis
MVLSNAFTHDTRVYYEAKSLINAGNNVTILAWDKKRENSSFEVKDGINITRSFNSKFMSLLPYDIFKMHFWWRKGFKDALKLYKKDPFEIIHCHDLDTLPIGIKLKNKLDLPLMYDAHEIWGYMVKKDLPRCWSNYYLKLEKRLLKNIDGFIIAEDRYADYFKKFTSKKMVPILNCKNFIKNSYEPTKNNIFTLIFIGTLSPKRYILELLDVVSDIDNVRCIIGGIGRSSYIDKIIKKSEFVENTEFIGKVSPKDIIPMTNKSDVSICMIDPSSFNNKIATANKQFEAMVCGRPIICTKGTRSGEITEEEKCGLVVEYNKEALKEAIIKLRDNPKLCEELGKNALKAAINKYNWELQEKKLLKLYEDIGALN